ncbi:MAG: hypothetical protein ACRDXX_00695 [Stackebrandtia sp.]
MSDVETAPGLPEFRRVLEASYREIRCIVDAVAPTVELPEAHGDGVDFDSVVKATQLALIQLQFCGVSRDVVMALRDATSDWLAAAHCARRYDQTLDAMHRRLASTAVRQLAESLRIVRTLTG